MVMLFSTNSNSRFTPLWLVRCAAHVVNAVCVFRLTATNLFAEQDSHFPPPRRRALEVALTGLASPEAPDGDAHDDALVGTGGYDYQIHIYSGVRHGFALRANLDIERVRWAKERTAENLKLW